MKASTSSPLPPGAALRWDIVRHVLPPKPGDMLEIGCGQGSFGVRMAARARTFLGLEPDEQSFEIAQQRLPGKVRNIMSDDLPADQTFDTVCAFEVIEHLPDDQAALSSWVARLRPGGSLFVSAPAHADRLGPSDALAGHYRRYDPEQMADLMRRAGLEDVKVRLYGFPLGFALEGARNAIARRTLARASQTGSLEERTAGSGRYFQPKPGLVAWLVQAGVQPFLYLQRLFPDRGIALVASGKRPRANA